MYFISRTSRENTKFNDHGRKFCVKPSNQGLGHGELTMAGGGGGSW